MTAAYASADFHHPQRIPNEDPNDPFMVPANVYRVPSRPLVLRNSYTCWLWKARACLATVGEDARGAWLRGARHGEASYLINILIIHYSRLIIYYNILY